MDENWSVGWDAMQKHSNNHNESHSLTLESDGTVQCSKCGWIVIYSMGELIELDKLNPVNYYGMIFFDATYLTGHRIGENTSLSESILKDYYSE